MGGHHRLGLPVAAGRWPVIGHLHRVFGNQPAFFAEMAGQGEFCWFDMGLGDWTLLWSSSEAMALLQHEHARSDYVVASAGPIVGRAVVARDGPDHKRARAVMARPLSPGGIRTSQIGGLMRRLIGARVAAMLDQSSVNVYDEMRELALEVIFRVLGVEADQLAAWSKAYANLLGGFVRVAGWLPGTPLWRARRARRWIDGQLGLLVDAVRDHDDPTGLLAAMVRGRTEVGQSLSDEELFDNVRILVLAGHETTASTMTWAVLHVLADPALFEALRDEVRQAGGPPVVPSDLEGFPKTEAVFREALRRYPPVAFTMRNLAEPTRLGGREIPAGVRVTVSLDRLSKDPAHYRCPERFDPSRWATLGRAPRPIETVQFGGGPHFCLGYHLAWLEVAQMIATLVDHVDRSGATWEATVPDATYFPLVHPVREGAIIRRRA